MRKLLVLAVILSSCLAPATAGAVRTRDVTNVERAYVGFALDQKNPDICAKISPLAVDEQRLMMPGRQVFYTRSYCFMHLAMMTQKKEYCSTVQQAKNAFFATGWYYERKNCEKLSSGEKPVVISYAVDYPIIMKLLGYIDIERKGRDWGKFYMDIRENQDKSLARRIKKLPDFSKATLEDLDFSWPY